ncbi:MAG: hypothetical protein ACYSRP_09325 [Planctomycetota bacterium]|jgi:hypothetical protein
MPTSRVLTILLLILFMPLAKGCSFDRSGVSSINSHFEGCWEGADWGGIHLYLEDPEPDLLGGFLLINLGGEFTEDLTAYSVQGEAKSAGLAILQGTNSSTPTQGDEITVLLLSGNNPLEVDDTVTLQINNGPPSTPLTRCP